MALSQLFLQHRAQILGLDQEEKEKKIKQDFSRFGKSFLEHRQQVLDNPLKAPERREPPQEQEVVGEPQKKGLFDQIKNAVAGAVSNVVSRVSTPSALGPAGAVLTPEQNKTINNFAIKLGKDILRAVPRAAGSVALTLKGEKELTPGTGGKIAGKAEKFLFGDEPVRNIRGTGKETIQAFGGSSEVAAKYGLSTGVALTALDLIPFGLVKKKVAETIAKEGGVDVIKNMIKTKFFKNPPDDVIEGIAKQFSTINDPRVIQKEIDSLSQIGKASKTQGSIIESIKGGFEGGRKLREEAETVVSGTLAQRARTQLVDRLTPIFDFVNQAAKKLPTEQNPYRKMRLLAGVSGKVEVFLDQKVAPILKAEKARQGDLSALLVLEREKELVGRGLTRQRNALQIEQGIAELKTKYGEEGFKTLQESAGKLRGVGNEMLEMLHKGGIIDDASFTAIKKNNQFYTPMEAVEHIADNLEKGRFGAGNSFNVASQDVIKGIKSYTGDVGDPIEALVRKIPKVLALTEKNHAMQSLVDLRKTYPDTYKDLIMPIAGDNIPKGMGVINLFENGKNVRYAVPEVVE